MENEALGTSNSGWSTAIGAVAEPVVRDAVAQGKVPTASSHVLECQYLAT